MHTGVEDLNNKGKFCFGLKLIVCLIKHYGYDFHKWEDYLVGLSDYTLIDFYSGTEGRKSRYWTPSDYSPAEILEPVYMPGANGRDFYPCEICGKNNWLFSDNGAESGFCLNFKSCKYVKEHYRYNRPGKNQYSLGKYREYYGLFMSADINLLRVIYDTLSLTDETAGELFGGDRMPIMNDIINVCNPLCGIPDLSVIPEAGFGKSSPCSFDSIGLITLKK